MTYQCYDSFKKFMEKFINPKNYRKGERLYERIDDIDIKDISKMYKGIPCAKFLHKGEWWQVNMDTKYDRLKVAYDKMEEEGGGDPFMEEKTDKGTRALRLRADLRAPRESMYLYIYKTGTPS